MEKDRDASALRAAADFLRRFGLQALAVSAGLLIPCFWHRRIEAGDLGSHVYNALLAPLIEPGQAPGLYLARRWNYVLFYLLLFKFSQLFRLAAAQQILLPLCVAVLYLMRHYLSSRVWDLSGPGFYNCSDQLALYSVRSYILSGVALLFGVACFVADRLRREGARESWSAMRLPLELHWVVVFAIYVLPDVLRIPLYSGWVGSLALRLTTVAAVMGLCVLAWMQPRKWHTAGFAIIEVAFFAFLYEDTPPLNRMEAQIKPLTAQSVRFCAR